MEQVLSRSAFNGSTACGSSGPDGRCGGALNMLVTMVMHRVGRPSFLVSRMEAVVACDAERRELRRDCNGTSRLMVLLSAAD